MSNPFACTDSSADAYTFYTADRSDFPVALERNKRGSRGENEKEIAERSEKTKKAQHDRKV